jgi:hypothetical protein
LSPATVGVSARDGLGPDPTSTELAGVAPYIGVGAGKGGGCGNKGKGRVTGQKGA